MKLSTSALSYHHVLVLVLVGNHSVIFVQQRDGSEAGGHAARATGVRGTDVVDYGLRKLRGSLLKQGRVIQIKSGFF